MNEEDNDEEAELQAAILARKAERAELKASEKDYLRSHGIISSDFDSKPKFLSKEERVNLDDTTTSEGQEEDNKMEYVIKLKNKKAPPRPPSPPKKREYKRQNDRRNLKRFKFEWDNTDDTSSGLDFVDLPPEPTKNTDSDRLLRKVDQKSALVVSSTWKDPSTKPLSEMTERDWKIVRENHDMRVKGGPVPNPARNWEEMNIPSHLKEIVHEIGYVKPTPIQMQAIPIGLLASDMIGIAETGSGKTCAFVLPLLTRLSQEPWASQRRKCADDGPLALILAPTRELVNQIEEEVIKLTSLAPWPARTVAVIGGASAEQQGFQLREGVDVLVATPGRLIDLLSSHICVLNHCSYIVLDEADRMIDMGFEPQVNKILESLVIPLEKRTMFMFSATMPPTIIRLSQRFMKQNSIIIRIGDEETGKNRNIQQSFHVFSTPNQKENQLDRVLSNVEPPIIIFCNSKLACDSLVRVLKKKNKKACALHSGRNQEERDDNFRKFKEGYYHILVATDVAGRGLDVEGVSLVVNYDCPNAVDRYSHRVGRTGRAGRSGKAVTFVVKSEDDPEVLSGIADYVKQTGQQVPKELILAIGDYSGDREANIEE